jgi:ubiquitin-like-conjugating enzyme ATG3
MELSSEQKKEIKRKGKELIKDGKEVVYTLKNMAWNEIHNFGDKLMPTLKGSGISSGMLTPDEFVKTGDLLVSKFGSWKWCGSIKTEGRRDYLPVDKQYLVTLQVPCEKRANDMNNVELTDDGEWRSVKYEDKETESYKPVFIKSEKEISDDFEEFGFEDIEEDEDLAAINRGEIVMCRRYNIYITYDNFYRTPRVWLSGTSEYGIPLNYHEIFEDILTEYRNRTVTLERFPYSNETYVSIHPCKHAETMKRFIERTGITSENYLLIFLKFISSVLPTVNYDFTSSVG